jgi:hypothetical protein
MFPQDLLAIDVALNELNGLKATKPAGGEAETANT